jgi:hypothetical protein
VIALPATPAQVLVAAIEPALHRLPHPLSTREAIVMLLAIGGQESGFRAREQVGGPAHGLWQFEKGGGVRGVLKHKASSGWARTLCEQFGVPTTEAAAYWALTENDELAAGFARLLLWTDPIRLPAIGDEQGAWDGYVRNWRPGKPHRERWSEHYAAAVQAVGHERR